MLFILLVNELKIKKIIINSKIYKSSKCNDMITTGYCPRGPFCAFAHIEQELKNQRAHSTSESSSSDYTLENFIANALPCKENESGDSLVKIVLFLLQIKYPHMFLMLYFSGNHLIS